MTIRTVRLPLALLFEVLWSYAAIAVVVALMGRSEGPAPSFLAVAAVVVGSFMLSRALQETEFDDAKLRAVGVVVSVVALYAIIYAEYGWSTPPWDLSWLRELVAHSAEGSAHIVTASIMLALVWMRGVARGQRSVDSEGMIHSAAFGIVPVAIAAGMEPATHGADVFGIIAIAYLVVVLGALALYQAPDPDRSISGYVSRWGVAMVAVLGGALALAVIAAAIDPRSLGALAPMGRPIAFALGTFATYVLGPPLALIAWLFGLVPLPHRQPEQPVMMQQQTPLKPHDQQDTPLWTRIIGWIVAGGLLALLAAGAVLVLWLLFRRFARRKEADLARRERVEPDSSLADDLASAFDALSRRFRRGPRRVRSRIEIRRLYQEMLDDSAESGLPRPVAATPQQFAPQLDAHYASALPSEISRAFAESRYGTREITPAVVARLRQDWRQIESARR